jgi:predicted metal-binding protein
MDTKNTGQMAWRTCFSSISYYGYKLDILKSAAQKYLRRREETKMLWCVGEIYLFHVFARTQQEKRCARGIITNLLNRIIIMMDEELLFAEWDKYLICRSLLEQFEKSKREDFISLIKVCRILCRSKLLRLNSDIRGYFDRGMRHWGVPKPKQEIKSLEEQSNNGFGFMKGGGCGGNPTLKKVNQLRKSGDNESVLLDMANFIYYFDKRDPNCLYWAFKISYRREKGARRFKRTDCEYIIWEYLFQKSKGNEYLMKYLQYKLEEYFVKNRGERFIWLTASVMAVMYKDNMDWNPEKLGFDIDVTEADIRKVFEGREKLEIDDYAIDMHCSLGRKMGKNKVDFIKEGSVVVDEDKEYFVQEWRDMYNGGKIRSFEKQQKKKAQKKKAPKKNEVPAAAIRAQKERRIKKMRGKPDFNALEASLEFIDQSKFDQDKIQLCLATTCGNKAMCFEYGGFIWKEGRETMNYNRDYICVDNCKLIFGLKPINMSRILSNFTIQKVNKAEKYWKDNWRKVVSEKRVVYCRMEKVGNSEELMKKKEILKTMEGTLAELLKIAIFRGIFRVSDFNLKNVLVDGANLVSIDEGEIGKRVGIIGGRNKWLVAEFNKHTGLLMSVLADINSNKVEKLEFIKKEMRSFLFSEDLIQEVEKNWRNVEKDLKEEGICIDVI